MHGLHKLKCIEAKESHILSVLIIIQPPDVFFVDLSTTNLAQVDSSGLYIYS
jgi:hypothetical protein